MQLVYDEKAAFLPYIHLFRDVAYAFVIGIYLDRSQDFVGVINASQLLYDGKHFGLIVLDHLLLIGRNENRLLCGQGFLKPWILLKRYAGIKGQRETSAPINVVR
ncbi:hypothetical protein D3C74_394080 [compost metagenome]